MVSATRWLGGDDLTSGAAILPIVSTVSMAVGTAVAGACFAWLRAGPASDSVGALRVVLAASLLPMELALVIRLRGARRATEEQA